MILFLQPTYGNNGFYVLNSIKYSIVAGRAMSTQNKQKKLHNNHSFI